MVHKSNESSPLIRMSTSSALSSATRRRLSQNPAVESRSEGLGHDELQSSDRADLRSLAATDAKEHILTTPLYGSIFGEAYYYLNLFVGNPPQKQSVILDTGSSILAFPCKGCGSCGKHVNGPFDFSSSQTARWLLCEDDICYSDRCSQDRNVNDLNHCDYFQAYSEGSSISGHYFSDLISLTAYSTQISDEKNAPMQHETQLTSRYDHIGCHELETKLFVGQTANGIIGVAFPHKNQPSAVDALFASSPAWIDGKKEQENTPKKIFTICISESGGIMTIGGNDPVYVRRDAKSLPYAETSESHRRRRSMKMSKRQQVNVSPGSGDVQNPFADLSAGSLDNMLIETKITSNKSYNIGARTLFVLEKDEEEPKRLDGSFGPTIIDSGTTYSYFPPKMYKSLERAIRQACAEIPNCQLPSGSGGVSDVCYTTAQSTSEETLDELDAVFPTFLVRTEDGAAIPWEPRSYMFSRNDGTNSWCTAIENNHMQETVFGMSFIKNRLAIFDREDMRLGILPGECPVTTDKTRDRQKGPVFPSDRTSIREAVKLVGGKVAKIKKKEDEQGLQSEESESSNEFQRITVPSFPMQRLTEKYARAKDYFGASDWQIVVIPALSFLTIGGIALIQLMRQRRATYTVQRDGDIRQTEMTQMRSEERPLSPSRRQDARDDQVSSITIPES